VVNNLRFPGQYFDAETGLHYNYHRVYDPETGRYLQPDPTGIRGGRNHLYVYAGGNPVIWIDPWGLFHYKEGVPPAGKDVEAGLTCMDTCLKTDLGISGGGEQSGHSEGSKHYSGEAADISSRMNPGLDKDKVMCCATKCGFQFAQGEGDHYHVQTPPGRGGASGELPKKECCDDKAGAAGASGAGQCCGK
jgi:RHS repeat-associated protein